MTSYLPDFEAIKKYRLDKEAQGYIFLEGENDQLIPAHLQERMLTVFDEAVAAGLIWEDESFAVSVKLRGVADSGKAFFTLSNSTGHGPWRDFLIKPGALPKLITYLNKDNKAIKARAASERQIKFEADRQLRSQNKLEAEKLNNQSSQRDTKCTIKVVEPNRPAEEDKNDLLKNNEFDKGASVPKSPSAAVIVGGFFCLIFLALAKVFFEEKYGHKVGEALSISFLVIAFAIPFFVAFRYVFERGVSEAPERFKKLLIGIVVFLIFGFFVALLDTGSGINCIYRLGCY